MRIHLAGTAMAGRRTLLGGLLALPLRHAVAADYPSRSIRVISPYTPGGGPDVTARILAGPLGRSLGQAIVVENRPGAGGAIGAEIAARITEECFYELEAPVLRVGGYHTPYPPSRLEDDYLPDLDRVLDAVDRSMAY